MDNKNQPIQSAVLNSEMRNKADNESLIRFQLISLQKIITADRLIKLGKPEKRGCENI